MARDPLREVVADAPFGLAVLDLALRFRELNRALAESPGMVPGDHLGRTVREVLPALADQIEPHVEALSRGAAVDGLCVRIPGEEADRAFHWQVVLRALRDESDRVDALALLVLDVTESVRTAEELDRRTKQQAAVASFGQRALTGADVDLLRDEVADLAASTLEVEFGEVMELDTATRTLLIRSGVGWRDGVIGSRITAGPQTQAGTVVTTRAPVVVENLDQESRFHAVGELRQHGVVSGASVPIQTQCALYGVLAAHSTRPRRFSTDDVSFLQALANVLGSAMDRANVETQLRRSADRLHLAMQAGRLGTWEWDMTTDRVQWSETLEAIYGLPAGGFSGTFEDFTARVHPDDRERVVGLVAAATEDAGPLPDFEHRIVRPDGTVRWLQAGGGPLRAPDGELVGMLGLALDVTERKRDEEERIRLLEAEQAARTQAEAARERLAFLARVTEAIGTTLDLDELLARVTSLSVGSFADGCAVDLLDNGVLRRVVLDHHDPRRAEAHRELRRLYPPRPGAGNALLRVVETGRPLLIERISEEFQRSYALDERHLALMRLVDVRSAMCVPLAARDRVLGLLSFVRDDDRPFDAEALELAEELARRLALAIDNALLFQERAEGERRFRRLAETLQASLLPPHLPEPPGLELAAAYRPAAKGLEVGGDFYDVFPLEGDTWGIVIGDVCGKGPEAATLTAFSRYTLRAAAVHHPSPSTAIATLNQAVLRDDRHEPGRFLTLAFARVRAVPAGAELTLSLGGHPQPLVVRADGSVEGVGAPGSLVGVLGDPELHDVVVTLAAGDAVLCFTDGVSDVRRGEEFFGESRLAELLCACAGLTPDKIVQRVEAALEEFGGGVTRDDRALLALRVPVG